MRRARSVLLVACALCAACAPSSRAASPESSASSGGEPAAEPSAGRSSAEAPNANATCIEDAEREAIDVSASTAERFEAALGAIDVPASEAEHDPRARSAANVRGLVLFDSIERDSSDPSEARLSAMLAMDVLGTLAAERPGCGGEACARIGPLLSRHCPVELPADDLTAACPTLVLYAERCTEAAR